MEQIGYRRINIPVNGEKQYETETEFIENEFSQRDKCV